MEAEQIEVVMKWPEPKLVQDIKVFLGFANFYCWFIKKFSKIAAPLTSMLKITMSSKVLAANEDGDIKGSDRSNDELKYVEPKTRKMSKVQKSSKSWKLAKSKKPSKSENSSNFNATGLGPSFLTPKARSAFNRLRLAFTEAPIFQHFDPECHIQIETYALGYAISGVPSQLDPGTSLDRVVTKADLSQ